IAAQNHFLRTTDRMIGRLEFMQARIEIAEQQGYAPEGASESIDKYILRLEGKGSEIRSADTAGDFASAARDIRKTWREIRAEMLRHTKYMIAARIGTFLEKSEILSDRLDEKISDLEVQGIDTENLRSNLEDYDEKIKCVRENYDDAKEFFDDGNTDEARRSIHEANVCIRDANHILKEIFKELREYRTGSVVLNGTGILTAEGSGRAMIRGAIEMSLTADAGSLSVCDRASDVNITISGNGTRTQQDSTMVYTGFNGTAYINGTDVTVTIRGSGVDLMAEGKGTAVLVGNGSYSVTQNGEAISSGEWREPDGGSK
ncbi:MAG: hypothetical protein U9N07_04480, partial [Euryarchaeota archaeon]|nr:hypothetical protein [Euryarchaeota archaeon]